LTRIKARRPETVYQDHGMRQIPEAAMRLFFLIFTLAATALAGIGVTAVLAAGLDGWEPIVISAAIGTTVAVPAAWVAAKKIRTL
jgi:hypothetical protein